MVVFKKFPIIFEFYHIPSASITAFDKGVHPNKIAASLHFIS